MSSDDESEEGLVAHNMKSSWVRKQAVPVPVPRTSIPQVVVCRERTAASVENEETWTEGSELEEIDMKQLHKSSPVTHNASGKKALG